MYDVIALGELLIDFASKSVDAAGYPTMEAAKEQILWSLQQADVVKISHDEVEFLWAATLKKVLPVLQHLLFARRN